MRIVHDGTPAGMQLDVFTLHLRHEQAERSETKDEQHSEVHKWAFTQKYFVEQETLCSHKERVRAMLAPGQLVATTRGHHTGAERIHSPSQWSCTVRCSVSNDCQGSFVSVCGDPCNEQNLEAMTSNTWRWCKEMPLAASLCSVT